MAATSTSQRVSAISSNFSPQLSSADMCLLCKKRVYPMEQMLTDKGKFHKQCFKCSHCKRVLNLSNFATNDGILFCKQHFMEKFKKKGNYEEGFGMKRHSMRWGADGKLPENGVVIPDNKKVVPQSQPQEQPKVESSNQQQPVAIQPSPPPSPQPAEPSSSTNPELLTNENADDVHATNEQEEEDDVDRVTAGVSAVSIETNQPEASASVATDNYPPSNERDLHGDEEEEDDDKADDSGKEESQ